MPSIPYFMSFSELSLPCRHFWGDLFDQSPSPRGPTAAGLVSLLVFVSQGERSLPTSSPQHGSHRALPVSVGLPCPAWQVTAPKSAVTLSSHGGGSPLTQGAMIVGSVCSCRDGFGIPSSAGNSLVHP